MVRLQRKRLAAHVKLIILCLMPIQPKHPTLSAFGRASTLSLGSFAFGSLIVTVLEMIRLLLRAVRNTADAEGHREYFLLCTRLCNGFDVFEAITACLALCADCFLSCIESIVRFSLRGVLYSADFFGLWIGAIFQ